ncbi:MAG TPA: hypothetical protein ENK75_03195 [Saprospiraceae bacterium]|nr:hypothetical protein [Saprospiraceae bacterium]
MVKSLVVGDPHIKPSNISEGRNLIGFIIKISKKEKVDQIIFLGDMFHTHAVKRLEVEHFWVQSLEQIDKKCILLCGNHDQIGNKEQEREINSLNVLKNLSVVVNTPYTDNKIAYIPYMSNKDKFIDEANKMYDEGARLLIVHQTFQGATYENGFYAPEGIDLNLLKFDEVISGHIHKSQQLGKCFYPGTPKWDTTSDANEDKGIWVFEHNEDGSTKDKKFFSTAKVVTPIYKFVVTEGEELPKLSTNAKNHIELIGSSAWIKKTAKKIGKKASIKQKPTDRNTRVAVENKSININNYLNEIFLTIPNVKKEDISNYLEDLNGRV